MNATPRERAEALPAAALFETRKADQHADLLPAPLNRARAHGFALRAELGRAAAAGGSGEQGSQGAHGVVLGALAQEAINRPNVDWQDKIPRGVLRRLRNISETA